MVCILGKVCSSWLADGYLLAVGSHGGGWGEEVYIYMYMYFFFLFKRPQSCWIRAPPL